MKKIIFVIVAAFSIEAANAQDSLNTSNTYANKDENYADNENPTLDKTFIWSIGLEPSIPVGHFHDLANFGFGGSLQGEIKAGRNVGITISGGYITYSGKTVDSINYPNFKYWPVMGGLKVYMGKAYLHGQAGAGFGEENLGTSFWYGAGLGINFTKRIDAEFRYMGWKQNEVSSSGEGGGIYNGGNGGNGGTGTPVYGGHYSTLGLRLAVNF
jgi:hypothetical protein